MAESSATHSSTLTPQEKRRAAPKKQCPHCGQAVGLAAMQCRSCGSVLFTTASSGPPASSVSSPSLASPGAAAKKRGRVSVRPSGKAEDASTVVIEAYAGPPGTAADREAVELAKDYQAPAAYGLPPPPAPKGEDTVDPNQDMCFVCRDGGVLICCDACPLAYHVHCLPELGGKIPRGYWQCPHCRPKDAQPQPGLALPDPADLEAQEEEEDEKLHRVTDEEEARLMEKIDEMLDYEKAQNTVIDGMPIWSFPRPENLETRLKEQMAAAENEP